MNTDYKNIKTEILAPAGSYAAFKAVINAGADAVYLGGENFGARAYAGNFTEEELLSAIDYAHIHNKKVYLTVNTLLKNNELFKSLGDYIAPFYEAGLDAVIVQDYGVMVYIHENFPDMDIHASTQMTITEPEYMDFLEKYNVTRIVPARELSLNDIRRLHEHNSSMEIETFVHGALCYCYSGQCLMSSFYGGRSGNRGRCAGTCRLEFEKNNKRYALLSLKDLSTLDILPDILDAGVYSLKIEGRMKSPEYAAGITSMYRKYIDLLKTGGRDKYTVSGEDKEKILMLFDRGGVTTGYYTKHNGRDMIANVKKTDKSLVLKDEYEKYLKQKYVDENIKQSISIQVSLLKNNCSSITVKYGDSVYTATGETPQPALNRPLTGDDVKKQVSKLGNTPFVTGEIKIDMDNDIFISNKSLNELRRSAVEGLCRVYGEKYRRKPSKQKKYEFKEYTHNNRISVRAMTRQQADAAIECKVDRIYLETDIMSSQDIKDIKKICKAENIQCFLAMPRVFRKDYNSFVEGIIPDFDGYLVRNMAQKIWLTKRTDGILTADYTMYGFNNLACKVLLDEGFDEIVCPVELNEKEISHLKGVDEVIVYGRQPLMISAGCIDKNNGECHKNNPGYGTISDRKNAKLTYITSCRYCYNIIYNSVPLFLCDKVKGNVSYMFCDEDAKEVKRILSNNQPVLKSYTRGHYTKGVE